MQILTPKLTMPPLRPKSIARPALVQRLNAGLEQHAQVTIISAAAGFGKTSIILEWLAPYAERVAWLTLDEGDNDPIRFLHYLLTSLQRVQPELGLATRELLKAPQRLPLTDLLTQLVNDLAELERALYLVLEDYHWLNAHETVQFLLNYLPPALHLIIGTRIDPPLNLARLRSQHKITELHEQDLRFSPTETVHFLREVMTLEMDEAAVNALNARTEGWITGLQLAALAITQHKTDIESFITGTDRFIADYWMAEVLAGQPDPIREFLCQTALTGSLNASLANHLTGRNDSQAMLDTLEANNLFLFALDHQRQWYRYHPLFADFLRSTLTSAEERHLHERAAEWYETHQFGSEALKHRLAINDYAHAQRLMHDLATPTLHQGNLLTLQNWLTALPVTLLQSDDLLLTYASWCAFLMGDFGNAELYLGLATTQIGEDAPAPYLLLQCYIALQQGEFDRLAELAQTTLQRLGEERSPWRVMALWLLAEAYENSGQLAENIRVLRLAVASALQSESQMFGVVAETFLANALHQYGKPCEAIEAAQQAITRYGRRPYVSILYSRLGMLYYEANQLDLAAEYLHEGVRLSQQMAIRATRIFAFAALATLHFAQGDIPSAHTAIEQGLELAAHEMLGDYNWLAVIEATLYLNEGNLMKVERWVKRAGFTPDSIPTYLQMEGFLLYTRFLIVTRQWVESEQCLRAAHEFLAPCQFFRWQVAVALLEALLEQERGMDSAPATLQRALALGEDYPRLCIDLASAPMLGGIGEVLTERELEVLVLIAHGRANQEIADELVISLGTVKRHINNIYGKFGVHSRTQAIVKAREQGLL